jgi:hypothetical protein
MSNLLMIIGVISLGTSFVAGLVIYCACVMAAHSEEEGRREFISPQQRARLDAQRLRDAQADGGYELVHPVAGKLSNQTIR